MAVVTLDRLTKIYERGHAPATVGAVAEVELNELFAVRTDADCLR